MKWKFPKIKRSVVACFIILCILSGLVISLVKGNSNSQVVASVNGDNITKEELYNLLVQQSGQQGLNALISQKIIELEAKKQKIVISDQEIQKEMEEYYNYYGGKEAFTQALEMSIYSLDDVKKDLIMNLRIEKLLKPRISITEEESKTYFEENKEAFTQEEQVKTSHILVKTKQEADKIREKLMNGEDFAKLAKEFSIDTMTKNNGGNLGYVSSGQMAKEFEKAAFALKVGEISSPVQTEYGYHLIKVEEKKEAKEANYKESKEQIADLLFQDKMKTEYQAWFAEIYPKYEIKHFL